MIDGLGQKIREMREEQHITREELCGDEIELSVRQLARIESGQSMPTLAKVEYIAKRLGITVGVLTDGESMELPKRYKELKYTILRTPVYTDAERISQREKEYDEISEKFYDKLPEEEQLIVDGLQSILDVIVTKDASFGRCLLEEYFDQLKKKAYYRINDLILIELYLTCFSNSSLEEQEKDRWFYDVLLERLLAHQEVYDLDELFILSRILINLFAMYLSENNAEKHKSLEVILVVCKDIMTKIQDFQRMPVLNLMEWKYQLLYLGNKDLAERCYETAIMFAKLNGDTYLEERLNEEWHKDTK